MILGQLNTYMENQENKSSIEENTDDLHDFKLNTSKLNELDYEGLSHLPYSPDLSPTDYHFFKHLDNLLQGKCFHNQHDIENAFKEFIECRSMDFYDTGINKFIPCWQKCIDCNGS